MNRAAVIAELADRIASIHLDHPVRVGIDGVDASGKTMLATELVAPLRDRGRLVVRASIDGFHNPRAVRHRQGPASPRGYYEDSFNHEAILSCVLLPLGPGGNRRFKPAVFDFRADSEVNCPWQDAPRDAVLLFDGVFLHRPELREHWDFSIFVQVGFDLTLKRAQRRDAHLFGSAERVREVYRQRYIPGQRLYLGAESPSQRADVVFDNTDIQNPALSRNEKANRRLQSTSGPRGQNGSREGRVTTRIKSPQDRR